MSVSSVNPPEIIPENPTIPEPSYVDASILYNPRKDIFKAAMSSEWGTVRALYSDQKVQGEYITLANDTLLHVAVSGAPEKIILNLLDIVRYNEERNKILNLQNKAGDTPLHLAAALGLEKVCRMMTKMCPDMVTSARNNLQETPLFSAVRHGKKNTFFVLEAAIHEEQKLKIDEVDSLSLRDITHCRGDDGNNILHHAIKGEQFDLAYEIIFLYPKLACMDYVNSNGETALHALANKPSVFKSGARFGLCDTIIYHCTITEPLTFQFFDFLENEKNNMVNKWDIQEDENKVLPPTYTVCIDIFSLMKESIKCISNIVASSLKTSGICKACCADDEENQYAGAKKVDEDEPSKNQKQRRRFPPNYDIMILFFKIIVKLVVLGIGLWRLQKITKLKQKHRNALTIMTELVDCSTLWEYEGASGGQQPAVSALPSDIGSTSPPSVGNNDQGSYHEYTTNPNEASPVLVAAKRGITEMVKRILKRYPVAVMDKDKDKKNIVLLAVEHRQVHVYTYMLGVSNMESIFRKVDKDKNSALHLAAKLSQSHPWTSGAALQMQWEFKWYKYVLRSLMNQEIFAQVNNEGKTPPEVFSESHDTLLKYGISWLTSISQSCSTVAALFATVAFASVSTVPGGLDQQSGFPILGNRPTFQLFAISSLVALCFSVTSIVMFLAILTSSFKVRDFERGLPMKLILGLASLFIAIASTLFSFCLGDFFLVAEKLKFMVYPIYAVMCFAVTFFAIAHYPLYISLIKLTIKKIPEPEVMQDY